jgi:hypothetical protein
MFSRLSKAYDDHERQCHVSGHLQAIIGSNRQARCSLKVAAAPEARNYFERSSARLISSILRSMRSD